MRSSPLMKEKMGQDDQKTSNLGNAGCNGSSGYAFAKRKDKEPVKENVQDGDNHIGNCHQSGIAVVSEEGLQVQRYGIGDGEQRPPEDIVLCKLIVAFGCAEETAYRTGQTAADESDEAANDQVDRNRVHEGALGACFVTTAEADRCDRYAADAGHGIQRLNDQDKGEGEIDGAQCLHSGTLSDENAVYHREQEYTGVGKNCRCYILKNDFVS